MIKNFSELSEAEIAQICESEVRTMLPILQAIDLPVSADGLRDAIRRDATQTVVAVTGRNGALCAWIRFYRPGESLFIKSIQLGENKYSLRPLLKAALPALQTETAEMVVSVVQGNNDASLSLHRKLGFQVAKELPRATRFEVSRVDLIERLAKLT